MIRFRMHQTKHTPKLRFEEIMKSEKGDSPFWQGMDNFRNSSGICFKWNEKLHKFVTDWLRISWHETRHNRILKV